CSNGAKIASIPPGTTYKDTSVSPSTSYSYQVRANDAVPNFSAYSNIASATTPTPDTSPPTPPTVTANAVSSGEIDLSWSGATDNVGVTSYVVQRCQGSGCSNFAQIATPTTTTYKDTSDSASTSYSYQLLAKDAAATTSPASNTASATTPAAPSGLVAAYAFNEGTGTTVKDASGNGNNGTVANTTWSTTGKFGNALNFNGTSSVVTIPNSASL